VPTSPASAAGELGTAQITRLAKILAQTGADGLFRVLLIHHPPAGNRAAHKRLIDAEPLAHVLRDVGAELVLHGHDHIASLNWLEGPHGRIAVFGVPSASASPEGKHIPAAYNLYRVKAGASGGWDCEVISRGFKANSDTIVELERRMLSIESFELVPPI
jgi:3',5'-cyclic AMP phosphodiesterase CpdA